MLRVRDREDLEQWFQWLLDPAFLPTRQRNPNVPTFRRVVNLLKKVKAKEEKPDPALEPLLLTAQEALRVSDFHTYHTPTPTSVAQGAEYPVQLEVSSMSGGAGNYAEAERLFVGVCIAHLLWPQENPYQRVAQQNVGQRAYDDRVAHGQQPDKQVRMRVKRFTREAIPLRWTAIGFSWPAFKSWKNWGRIYPRIFSDDEQVRMKTSRLMSANKREVRFIKELLKVQLPGWGPPPVLRPDNFSAVPNAPTNMPNLARTNL